LELAINGKQQSFTLAAVVVKFVFTVVFVVVVVIVHDI
jgi:hypothetical protein